jgi:hypothetical protein
MFCISYLTVKLSVILVNQNKPKALYTIALTVFVIIFIIIKKSRVGKSGAPRKEVCRLLVLEIIYRISAESVKPDQFDATQQSHDNQS